MDSIRDVERRTEEKRAYNEELDQELSAAQKKAAIKEAKAQYGTNWKKMIGGAIKSLKINKESLQTLHSFGAGGNELREMSKPALLRRYK